MPAHLKVGAAERVITPPVGTSLAGYFHDRPSTAVRDDLRKPKSKLRTNEQRFLNGIAKWDKEGQIADVEVQAMRLGDAVFIGLPGEPFCVWGFELKKWSPFPYTFVAEQSNQSYGYIATWEAVGRGGYEAIPFVGTQLARGAGQTMVDTAFTLARSLA